MAGRRRRPPTEEEARAQNEAQAEAPKLPDEIPDFSGERQLAAKLAWVMGQVGFIPKRGWNAHFKYPFVREADLKAHIAPLLSRLHVFLLADVIDHDKAGDLTRLNVKWTFIDGDTGERESGTMVGYGSDRGDKGANKAMTAALKFFLIPTFLVVSGDDAEADVTTDQRAEQRPEREVAVRASSADQPERGGHATQVTSVHINRISELSQRLNLGSVGVAGVVEKVLGVKLELPAEPATAQARALVEGLLAMDPSDVGKVINALQAQAEALEATEQASATEEEDGLPDVPETSADVGIGYGD